MTDMTIDLAENGMLAVTRDALAALRNALMRDAGPSSAAWFQEAGYAGLGAIFGVAPELSLAVSLVRRGRDLAVGVPVLLIWQFFEMRQLRGASPVPRPGAD